MKDCQNGTMFNNSCYYKTVKHYNWFDAMDQCKYLGGNLISKNILHEAESINDSFLNIAPFWVHNIAQFSERRPVVNNTDHGSIHSNGTKNIKMYGGLLFNGTYSNASQDGPSVMNDVDESETSGKMERSLLCTAFNGDDLIEVNCSNLLLAVCEIPGKDERRG